MNRGRASWGPGGNSGKDQWEPETTELMAPITPFGTGGARAVGLGPPRAACTHLARSFSDSIYTAGRLQAECSLSVCLL